jgi:ubiquinone/menaquinone biosynthesis C-methylase UbiE
MVRHGSIARMHGKGWESKEFAEAWKARAEERRRNMAAMTEAMFEAARIGPGARVLDLGTGTGDTALLAAERVGPNGRVVATDASPAMAEAAREAVEQAGAANVTVRVMDASAIDVDAEAFDAVIARQVLMFVDRPRALAGVLRALRSGGRLGAAMWGPLAKNRFHGSAIEAARARGGWGEPAPEMVRAFSVEDPSLWKRWLEEAGFADVSVQEVPGERRFASPEEALAAMKDSPIHREPIERLPEAVREEAWREVAGVCRAMGGVFPTVNLVVAGGKG